MVWGEYPAEFNPKVHGPYDPARFYGKKDTPFTQVRLRELGSWLARRNKTPRAATQAVSRAWWRWQQKYLLPEKMGVAPFIQIAVGSMAFFYLINYTKYKAHRTQKYHW
ncbi:putative ATP synthase subunit f, mitochondrial [Hyalella azteca]|uniref:ATP synthase subunit f, mitochondrial n=1 Tax=Hyalella azteca TaxID=294128 RepID=A0A8B7NQ81_HYAAZ|nr:putative ATP synthase subunit f, mitochondrial [Hyalella azteca]